ncbi:MAG: hypothetical protein WCP20_23845 [Desulfuromonadales bacterium]
MLNNTVFTLTNEELANYNSWAAKISRALCEADFESWTLSVKFSFSNFGSGVVAHCESNIGSSCDLVIRDMFEGYFAN